MSAIAKHFIDLLAPYIHSFGYLVAFLGMSLENMGIPVPGETALIVVSFFAAQGALNIWIVLPLALIGDVAGDCLGYAIGRYGGRPLAERWGRLIRLDRGKLDAAEELYREKGGRTVFASQFSSISRLTGSIAAGLSHMPFRRFLTYDSAAALLLVSLVGGATFYFGKNVDAVLRLFHGVRVVGLTVVTAIVAAFFVRYYQPEGGFNRRQVIELVLIAAGIALLAGLLYYVVTEFLFEIP
jgi:membrane protein DedA with SNARE-associated domain